MMFFWWSLDAFKVSSITMIVDEIPKTTSNFYDERICCVLTRGNVFCACVCQFALIFINSSVFPNSRIFYVWICVIFSFRRYFFQIRIIFLFSTLILLSKLLFKACSFFLINCLQIRTPLHFVDRNRNFSNFVIKIIS